MPSVTSTDTPPCRPDRFYSGLPARVSAARPDELEVGTLTVTFPPGHQTGAIERPLTIFSFSRDEDPARDIVISELSSSGSDYDAWVRQVRAADKQQAFIYVHGYATKFADAARRAGQMAFDLDLDVGFGGLPMLYSWPSSGTRAGYLLDYDTSLDATEAFNRFLDLVKRQAGVSRVHVIAHSMGNQLVASALRERVLAGETERLVDQLVLAAPDIWADRFRDRFLTTLPQLARRVTLYLSDNDWALKTSAQLRDGNARAGLRNGGLLDATAPGFDVVDATELPAEFLDHSYYANNQSMLADMYCLLQGSAAAVRPLIRGAGANWRFKTLVELTTLKANACVGVDVAAQTAPPAALVAPMPASESQRPGWLWLVAVVAAVGLVAATVAWRRRRPRLTPST
jgi:esterase/lipase superfamily enzyme